MKNIFLFIFVIITVKIGNGLDSHRKKLVIDHDGGADDAIAITMSLLYEQYFEGPHVVALTTTYGNVNLTQCIINSARILDLCGRNDVPIYAGAEGPLIDGIKSDHFFGYDGLGDEGYFHEKPLDIQKEHSAVALIELSKKYEGELIVIAIGPVTNIALAIRLDPGFISRLAQLYVGGGYVYSKQYPEAEFNVAMDPESYYIVADVAEVNTLTFVPFSQVKETLSISKEWRENVFGAIPTPIVQALNGYERLSLAVSHAWTLLDPAVAAIFLDPEITEEFKNASISLILCGDQRGITDIDFSSTYPNSRVFYAGNVEYYKQLLIKVYSAELNNNKKKCKWQ